jgi:hypothetical protein
LSCAQWFVLQIITDTYKVGTYTEARQEGKVEKWERHSVQ